MLGAHYSEECMDELLKQMDKFLETHSITTLLEIVAVSIERCAQTAKRLKEQDNCENCAIAIEDRQPIVRCKDCKYWHETIYDTPKWMPCMSVQTSGNWFCADGEMKE